MDLCYVLKLCENVQCGRTLYFPRYFINSQDQEYYNDRKSTQVITCCADNKLS